jgi:polyphosphate kinase 2 (PPK2 family)
VTAAPGCVRRWVPGSREHGYTLDEEDEDDPVLLDRDGNPVETWREGFELLKLQNWSKRTGARHVIVFEGRDAAGKGGTIQRFTEHLNPRGARVVALDKPTDREGTQWYFQRYVSHLPAGGEMVLFDRSWYNRAGVERVMGFCTAEQYDEFIRQTDTDAAPWIVVKSNDKKRARLNAMRFVLGKFEYDDKDHELVGEADPLIVGRALAD